MRTFHEKPSLHQLNRDIFRKATVAPARLADGAAGAMLRLGDRYYCVTESEILLIAERAIEAAQALRSEP